MRVPWDLHPIDARSSVEIVIHGPEDGAPEIEARDQDDFVFYGWPGCRVVVLEQGRPIYSTLDGLAVPATPSGQSVRDFVKAMFR